MGQLKWAFFLAIAWGAMVGKCRAEDQQGGAEQQQRVEQAAEQQSSPASQAADNSRGQSLFSARERQAEERIENALDQPLRSPLDFVDTPINTIMSVLAEEYDMPILFDKAALEAAAVSPDMQISVNLRNVSLRSALDLMLNEVPEMTYVIDSELLLLTTEDEASKRLQTRVYQIDDLIPKQAWPAPKDEERAPSQFVPIVEVITRCIERDSWATHKTGEGEICVVEPGAMVVTQTQRVHREIERLLATIRRVKVAIDHGDPAAAAVSMIAEAPPDAAAETSTATEPARDEQRRAATPVAENRPFGGF